MKFPAGPVDAAGGGLPPAVRDQKLAEQAAAAQAQLAGLAAVPAGPDSFAPIVQQLQQAIESLAQLTAGLAGRPPATDIAALRAQAALAQQQLPAPGAPGTPTGVSLIQNAVDTMPATLPKAEQLAILKRAYEQDLVQRNGVPDWVGLAMIREVERGVSLEIIRQPELGA